MRLINLSVTACILFATSFLFSSCSKSATDNNTTPPTSSLDYWTLNDTTYSGLLATSSAGAYVETVDSLYLHFCQLDFRSPGGFPYKSGTYKVVNAYTPTGYYQLTYSDTTNCILDVSNYLRASSSSPYEEYESVGAPGDVVTITVDQRAGTGSSTMTFTFSNIGVAAGYGLPTKKVSGKITYEY